MAKGWSSDTHSPSSGPTLASRHRSEHFTHTALVLVDQLWSSRFLSPIRGCAPNHLEPRLSGIFLHQQQVSCSHSPMRFDPYSGVGLGVGVVHFSNLFHLWVFSLILRGSSTFCIYYFFILLSSLFPLLAQNVAKLMVNNSIFLFRLTNVVSVF